MNWKSCTRIIALGLAFASFFTGSMREASAAASENIQNAEAIASYDQSQQFGDSGEVAYSPLVGEDADKRAEAEKHFLRQDGKFEAVSYPFAVNYMSDGKWQTINNTLKESVDPSGAMIYQNAASDLSVAFAADLKNSSTVAMQYKDYKLAWSLENAQGTIQLVEPEREKDEDMQLRFPAELQSIVDYKDAINGADFRYSLTGKFLSEYITLSDTKEISESYRYRFNCGELTPKLDNRNVVFIGKEGEVIFTMTAPYMTDANGIDSDEIDVKLEQDGESYVYTLIPSMEWLKDEKRAYPVIIDPEVLTPFASGVEDTYVSPDGPNGNYSTRDRLKVGGSPYYRAFIKLNNLPTLASGDLVIESNISLSRYNTSTQYGKELDMYRVAGAWTGSTLTWNNKPNYDDTRIEALIATVTQDVRNEYNITRLVKKWYTGELPNYGVMIKLATESSVWYTEYRSSEYNSAYAGHPYASVIYINTTGIENTWTYHTQDIGRAGTAYVNDFNGNLVILRDDAAVQNGTLPISLNHVYNTHDKTSDVGYGLGWRLNYSQTVSKITLSGRSGNVTYYCLTDADGTRLYYKYSTATQYVSELDKDSTLTIDTAVDRITIADKSGHKLIFACDSGETYGRLIRSEDANGNAVVVSYIDTLITNLRISTLTEAYVTYSGGTETVTAGSGAITLGYTGNLLSTIEPSNGLDTVLSYTSSRLTNVAYTDGEDVSYIYDGTGNIQSAINIDGYTITYQYTTNQPSRVTLITESNGGTQGQQLALSYGWNRTTFGDTFVSGSPTRFVTYLFDNMGKTISVRDADGSAQYAAYNTADRTVTQLSAVSKLQKTNVNLLTNHGIETTAYWSFGSGASQDANYRHTGRYSAKLNNTSTTMSAYISQQIAVTPGATYTLSAYFSGASNGVVRMYNGSAVFAQSQPVQTAGTVGTDWYRGQVTFTVPAGVTIMTVSVALLTGNTGIVYTDSVQLEKGKTISRYNMLENSDFQLASTGNYTVGSNNGTNSVVTSTTDSTHPNNLDSYVYRVEGSFSYERYLYQSITVAGAAGDVYSFGTWFQANGVPKMLEAYNNRYYGVKRITLKFLNGSTVVNTQEVPIGTDTDEWQFVAGSAVASGVYTQIQVYIEYNYTRNNGFFDGLFLCKEQFASSYGYDANGNINSAKSVVSQTASAQYDTNNNLTSSTDPRGNVSTFTYDGKHNLLTATSDEGVLTTNTYNSKGQAQTTKIGSSTNYIGASTTYFADSGLTDTITDARGNDISYAYDANTRQVTSVTDARGNVAENGYANAAGMLRLTSNTAPTGIGTDTASVAYAYAQDRLESVTRNFGTDSNPDLCVYSFAYDTFGRTTETKVGNTALSTNTYNTRGLLETTTYATGFAVKYLYDSLDRLIEVQYRPDSTGTYSTAFLYGYDGDGNLAFTQDVRTSTAGTTRYDYDLTGRLMKSERFNGSGALVSTYRYEYDLNDNLAKIKQTVANRSWDVTYSYDGDNRPVSVVSSGMATVTDAYDATLGLRTNRTYAFASPFTVNFSYIINGDGTKTALLAGYQNGTDSAYAYTYDENGNITQISKGGTSATYVYDKANQLIRENDGFSGKTWTYSYDKFGNMLEKVEYDYTTGDPVTPLDTITYGYSTGEWKDQLVSYDGQTIAYDAMGNPTTYLGETLTWTDGRKLASYGTTASYVYDKEGMRVQKTVGANVTDFYYNGSLLLGQKTGTIAQYYTYDASGNLLAIYYNGAYYYYLRNGQSDIVGLLDGTGAVVVSYSYDAWGKPLATTGTLATTLGADNPFRYRGYYYDTETGLYYLQSRYYDPDTCRFLNGDVLMSTGQGVIGYNMYAYCNNEPVVYSDSSGNNPAIAIPDPGQVSGIGAAIGAIAGTITGASLGTILLVVLAVVVVVAVVVTLVKSAEEEKAKPQHTVYYLRDPQTGEVEYVGRTKNYQSRMAAHARSHRKDLVPEKVMSGLNYYEARALEDKLMLEQHTLNTLRRTANQIRGISPTSDFGIGLAEAAKGIANYYSNKISDDVMNLLGF